MTGAREQGDGSRLSDGSLSLSETLDGTLGLQIVELAPTLARGNLPVTNRVRQRWGLVHGGAYAALAELLASEATTASLREESKMAVGLSNHTSFLRPITDGTVHATAHRRHGGATTWVWEVELTDDGEQLCGISRVTVAIRPQPGGGN